MCSLHLAFIDATWRLITRGINKAGPTEQQNCIISGYINIVYAKIVWSQQLCYGTPCVHSPERINSKRRTHWTWGVLRTNAQCRCQLKNKQHAPTFTQQLFQCPLSERIMERLCLPAFSVRPSVCFISETADGISMKFCIGRCINRCWENLVLVH